MAFSYAGTEHHELPSSADFDGTYGSVVFWVKTSQAQDFIMLTGRHNAAQSREGFIVFINDDATSSVEAQLKNTGGAAVVDIVGTTGVRDGAWHHVCLTWGRGTGDTCRIYIDGSDEANASPSAAWAFNSQVVRLAESIDTFWVDLSGDLADWRWYDRQLSADEVASLAAGISARFITNGAQAGLDLIREEIEHVAQRTVTVGGTPTVSSQPPRMIYPAPPHIVTAPAAVAAAGLKGGLALVGVGV